VKNESVTKLEFKDGFLNLVQPGLLFPEAAYDEVCTVTHACGGFSAFDREKFLGMGGFDDLYYPFYWEDVDLCYRAWKRGWWVLYEPKSIAHHKSHATIDKTYHQEYVAMLHVRNKLLFTWKNLTDPELLIEHVHGLNSYFHQAPEPFKQAVYEALKKIYDVLHKRSTFHEDKSLSDREVIELSANRFIEQGIIK
jgi:GT2 family glycosyltransferase